MNKIKISENIYAFTMNVDEMMFESMWDLPNGVTMNSYIVKGKDIAIIDGVIGWDGVPETLYKALEEMQIKLTDIKYLVVNHVEPDHSGWIDNFKKITKDFQIVTTQKGQAMIKAFYGDEFDILVVKDGDTIDLGNGKILEFHPVPNVHWPETMITYEKEAKALFSCDLYGAFGTLQNDSFFEDEMNEESIQTYETEGVRYFTNVMMTFATMIKKAIAKTKTLDIAMILPGHGPLFKNNPQKIIDEYEKWTEFASGKGENEVTIIWGSMYGMTEKAVIHAKETIEAKGIKVNLLHLPYDTISDVMTKVLRSAAIIVAAPTYEYKMFPPVAHALDELGRKRMTGKTAMYLGSYGWSGGARKDLEAIMESYHMNWNFVDFVEFNGFARQSDYQAIDDGIGKLIAAMKEKIFR